jgi:hypothetical protein
MVGRLLIAGAILAPIPRVDGANADPQLKLMLVPPVSPACISSPYGPRVLAKHSQAGTYHHGVDLTGGGHALPESVSNHESRATKSRHAAMT